MCVTSGGKAPQFRKVRQCMKLMCHLHVQNVLLPGKRPPVPFGQEAGSSRSQCGRLYFEGIQIRRPMNKYGGMCVKNIAIQKARLLKRRQCCPCTRHEGLLGEQRYSSTHSQTRHQIEVSDELHTPTALPHEVGGGVGHRAGLCVFEMIEVSCSTRIRIPSCQARSLFSIPTMVPGGFLRRKSNSGILFSYTRILMPFVL